MKAKPVVPRELAGQDIDRAIERYLNENAAHAAHGFVDALEQAFNHFGRHPATGSPRYAHALYIPDLRCWPLTRYPYWAFYIERSDHVNVWRVLHAHLDIPAWMKAPDDV